ncbi:hypothetical protein GQ651_09290 [Alphaproteobacteria bacterium GH1-50]|uniref:Uncharacterized protein n=1 Tax=Kangsaoukella pontilimi TaxID=2691042 RepID=A0A7C9MG12_9RHOB|nr:hypothetical protein [Kangsaoukella pontilimi]MXQ08036.1 hypothetical protein [Kangsaoukella pontilimi]
MDSKGYIQRVLQPLVEKLREKPYDQSLTYSASILIYHCADWIAEENREKPGVVVARLISREPMFEYLQAVANMHKHKELRRDTRFKGLTSALKPSQLNAVFGGKLIFLPGGRMVTNRTEAFYEFQDGTRIKPLDLIEACLVAVKKETGV